MTFRESGLGVKRYSSPYELTRSPRKEGFKKLSVTDEPNGLEEDRLDVRPPDPKTGKDCWGKKYWFLAHLVDFGPGGYNLTQRLLKAYTFLLPCEECKNHLRENLRYIPDFLAEPGRFSYGFHDTVNKQIYSQTVKKAEKMKNYPRNLNFPSIQKDLKESPDFSVVESYFRGVLEDPRSKEVQDRVWVVVHTAAYSLVDPSQEEIKAFKTLLEIVKPYLDLEGMKEFELSDIYFGSRESLLYWTYKIRYPKSSPAIEYVEYQGMPERVPKRTVPGYAGFLREIKKCVKNECSSCDGR
jgi:hypothetical protein